MDTLSSPHLAPFLDRKESAERTAPEGKRRGPPVLMLDCATPLNGTTLLHTLWQRWETDRDGDQS